MTVHLVYQQPHNNFIKRIIKIHVCPKVIVLFVYKSDRIPSINTYHKRNH